jgi:hypothetical protein
MEEIKFYSLSLLIALGLILLATKGPEVLGPEVYGLVLLFGGVLALGLLPLVLGVQDVPAAANGSEDLVG